MSEEGYRTMVELCHTTCEICTDYEFVRNKWYRGQSGSFSELEAWINGGSDCSVLDMCRLFA
jgi:hypothetical protein